ncbi:MAG: 23S rRNA (pseudouridine(1915)-N(3))-methyltransferase RlmH [Gammaproteobacteria bacterium]|nr:23S rRNA (pseudouridine(1915)-N(3))-methyltransferase RlmH [Gammaproteobacteria bacterium]
MRLKIITVGRRPPRWVQDGFNEFANRMPRHLPVDLVEVPPGAARRSGDVERAREQEADALLAAAGSSHLIALDEQGVSWTTRDLAGRIDGFMQAGGDVAFLVGGADGLADRCRAQAVHIWSLSTLTLPHLLVRVVLAEQLYRAFTLLDGHPYHRD